MHTVAITGATGFVGNFVANYLESKGYKVFRFGRKDKKGVLQWDISRGIYTDFIKVDCVVHCAASVDDWASYKESHAVNVTGTQNVLKSFPQASQFIYISSASVYNAFCEQVVIKEFECLGGKLLNSYSKTKLLGEKEVEKSNIESRVILRPHIIYGLGDTTIAPRIKNGIKFGYFPVPGNGKNKISFTNVENLAQAILQAIKISKKGFSIYNITDKESFTFTQALKEVKKLNNLKFKEFFIPKKLCLIIGSVLEFLYTLFGIKKSPLLTRYIVDQMSSDHIFDITKAQNELQYNPERDIKHDFLL
jgi:nucleoside-diphosphate-sugar epimerase